MSRVQAQAEKMMLRHGFLGVSLESFEQAGREQLIALLGEGFNPESKLLEFGCGCLRIAYWLVRFLDAGCYYGIEPAHRRVEVGLQYLLADEAALKTPHFDFNADFDASMFGTTFDFFLARSIWSHASRRQIGAMLDTFLRTSTASSVFLTSYFPTQSSDARYQAFLTSTFPADPEGAGYQGDTWVGTSHESDMPGVIQHSIKWLIEQCELRGLQVEELPGWDCDSQFWLKIRHKTA